MGLLGFFGASKIFDVETIDLDHQSKEDFLVNFYLPRIPVLIKGGSKNWPIFRKWTKEYVIKTFGNYQCTIVHDSRPASSVQKDTLKNYFENYRGKSTLSLEKFNERNSFFLKDITIPNPLFNKSDIARYFFYHSVEDAGTLPHMHRDAFNILKEGRKHWVFYDANKLSAPKGFRELQKCHKIYPSGSHAKDWFKRELRRTPNRVEKVFQCFQEPGDIIYIPTEYAHTVLNKSEVMGLVVETYRKQ